MTRIGVIGAGLTGLTLAHLLRDTARVVVFEKSRGVGGRMATRRLGSHQFDHGAQFFTCQSDAFASFLAPYVRESLVVPWTGKFVELDRSRVVESRRWQADPARYVAVPGMNALGKRLADGIDVRLENRIDRVAHDGRRWRLLADHGGELGEFDWVVSTLPAAQAESLMPARFSAADELRSTRMAGCYALMLGFDEPLDLEWQAARVLHADISWISIDSSKPGRPEAFSLLAHSTNDYAEAQLDTDPRVVEAHLLEELAAIVGTDVERVTVRDLHRWRYANAARRTGRPALVDRSSRLAACGDWCIQGRVEAAFSSAAAVAAELADRF